MPRSHQERSSHGSVQYIKGKISLLLCLVCFSLIGLPVTLLSGLSIACWAVCLLLGCLHLLSRVGLLLPLCNHSVGGFSLSLQSLCFFWLTVSLFCWAVRFSLCCSFVFVSSGHYSVLYYHLYIFLYAPHQICSMCFFLD